MNRILAILIFIVASPSFGVQIDVSDHLKPAGKLTYVSKNLSDRNLNTAWCASAGKGEPWININAKSIITKFVVLNGYAKNKKLYYSNARAKDVVIITDAGEKNHSLLDTPLFQIINIAPSKEIRVVVKSAYEGKRYDDVCMTEIVTDPEDIATMEMMDSVLNATQPLTDRDVKIKVGALYKKKKTLIANILDILPVAGQERVLRFILNMQYYCYKYESDIDAEFTERLSNKLENFFEYDDDVILRVIKDVRQVNRRGMVEAFFEYYEHTQAGHDNKKRSEREKMKNIMMLYNEKLPFEPWHIR